MTCATEQPTVRPSVALKYTSWCGDGSLSNEAFAWSQWNRPPSGNIQSTKAPNLRNGQFLGRGAQKIATVTLRQGVLVARLTSTNGTWTDLLREITLMRKTALHPHPHLLPLLDVECDALLGVSMVVPIARFGSMLDLVDHLEFDGLSLDCAQVAVAMLQISKAVLHLAGHGLDHGDLAARNLLVHDFDAQCPVALHVCLGDFGNAREAACDHRCLHALARELHALVLR